MLSVHNDARVAAPAAPTPPRLLRQAHTMQRSPSGGARPPPARTRTDLKPRTPAPTAPSLCEFPLKVANFRHALLPPPLLPLLLLPLLLCAGLTAQGAAAPNRDSRGDSPAAGGGGGDGYGGGGTAVQSFPSWFESSTVFT